MKNSISLSSGDSQVLSHIFHLESALTAGVVIDSNLPADPHVNDPALLSQLKARELEAIKYVETSSKGNSVDEVTKDKTFLESFRLFSLLIEEYPKYASAYDNRAHSFDGGTATIWPPRAARAIHLHSCWRLRSRIWMLQSDLRHLGRLQAPSLHHKPNSLRKLTHNEQLYYTPHRKT
jgi:hypothetical protein